MSLNSSKDMAIRALGAHEVQAYEEVKRYYMLVGFRLAAALLVCVGGRVADASEGCDGITRLGKWEFCTQGNTKNKAGKAADEARCPGRCVQIFGTPMPGWISGRTFLELHGVSPDEFEALVDQVSSSITVESQRRFPV